MSARFSLDNLPTYAYKILIVIATAIWGVSFVFMKDVVSVLPPAWLLGIRFTCAGIILLLILRKRVAAGFNLRFLGMGVLLGVLDFSAFLTQTIGLQHTTPGINAFLTATYCVIVPFIWWLVARRRPTVFNIGAALLAVGGIWLVSVSSSGEGLTMGFGEAMTLVGAFAFAVHIVAVSKCAQYADALALTAMQFISEGLLGLATGALTAPAPALSLFTPDIIAQMAFLILLASIFCFGAQNLALAHVPPAQASLLLSLESVFGVVFSVFMTGEQVTLRLLLGFVLIFAAITVSEVFPIKKKEEPSEAVGEQGRTRRIALACSARCGRRGWRCAAASCLRCALSAVHCLRALFDWFSLSNVSGLISGNIGIRNPTSGQVVTALTGAFALGYSTGQDVAHQESWE